MFHSVSFFSFLFTLKVQWQQENYVIVVKSIDLIAALIIQTENHKQENKTIYHPI